MTQHNLSAFGLDLRAGHNVLYLLLLILVFSVAVTTGTWDIGNSRVVLYHELVFIVAYILVFRGEMPLLQDIRQRPFVVALVLLWAVSITVSLWQSPLQLRHLTIAQFRYAETLAHVAFFAVLYSFFRAYSLPYRLLFTTVLVGYALIVVHAFMTWHFSPDPGIHSHRMWFSHFPFAGHARHAGYNMMVACIAGVTLWMTSTEKMPSLAANALGLFLVGACLIWLGGRGSMLSVVLAVLVIGYVTRKQLRLSAWRVWLLMGIVTLALLAAELAAQFRFNGLYNSFVRSLAADDLNRLSSSRLAIWADALSKLEGHWLMGFGSQAYLFLPDKLARKTSMPHNMIVQFLVEWGIVGTLLFLTILVRYLRAGFSELLRVYEGMVSKWYLLGSAAVVLALMLHGLTDGTFYHGKASFYMALFAGVWMSAGVTENVTADAKGQFLVSSGRR
ncbi:MULTISPECIES: O-antigen ligase family protein [Spongiibacter]|uniref:O-antigen ligase family protein n=1 Tax=Spongiibacter TaxID=630749 RepID=UPI0023566E7E|nr:MULTISPECIES: O-antigen ligase family protein [Spongiibacter]|tara:strand:- start:3254 stop:4591 length:1338 start_codon:yes stop_codon:yes gene_type:complete